MMSRLFGEQTCPLHWFLLSQLRCYERSLCLERKTSSFLVSLVVMVIWAFLWSLGHLYCCVSALGNLKSVFIEVVVMCAASKFCVEATLAVFGAAT